MGKMRDEFIIGMDLGTSSCKVCAVNFAGRKMAQHSVDYATLVPHAGWAEQDPRHWIPALSRACKALLEKSSIRPDQVKGVSLSAAAHIAVLLDRENQPLRNAILWLDQRASVQADKLAHKVGPEILELTNNCVSTTWTLPHLLWVYEREPEVWRKVRHILLSKDYVGYLLTGSRITDPSSATSSMLYDVSRQAWSSKLCSLAYLEPDYLPEVLPANAQIGTLLPVAAQQFGLENGIPVINGSLDSTAETFCAKLTKPGDLAIRLASAGGVHLLLNQAQPHPKLITYPYPIPPIWLVQAGTNSCASAVQWVRKALNPSEGISYDQWDSLSSKVEPGAQGLIFHPYLSGERCPYWDSRLRASFVGLNFNHGFNHFARAVYEGCAFSLKDALLMLKDMCPVLNDLTIIGGGAKSKHWCSIVCDVLGAGVARAPEIDSAYGTALIGLNGLGVYSTIQEAQRCADFEKDYLSPNANSHNLYNEIFAVYQKIQQRLKPIYHQ
jgi:xylulokinase